LAGLPPSRICVLVLAIVLVLMPFSSVSTYSSISTVSSPPQTNSLSDHWVSSWNCFRDELNQSDQDYNNCWMDNAGKILISSEITGDATDAARSLGFIESYLSNGSYYLPELRVNGTSPFTVSKSPDTLSNNIIELSGNNASVSHYDQLAIGTSYTGPINLGYLGADRVCFRFGSGCNTTASISSQVFQIPKGFSKRSLFEFQGLEYYMYLNATMAESNPFANVSIQLEPLNSSSAGVQYVYLQVFNSTAMNPFYAADLYNPNGSFNRTLPFNDSDSLNQGGYLLSYSNATNVFTTNDTNPQKVTGQDAVAIKFSNQSIYTWEHWANDFTGYNRSWFGLGFDAEQNVTAGSLSKPIYAQVYPILDFDYHLANDTIRYIATSGVPNVAVSPPVDFGAISYGLALAANKSASNATLSALARGYWNYYYETYNQSDVGTPYARSINLLSLAGFKLYGCNSTVENFTRRFLGSTSGGAIEEFGWGVAALYQLKNCTENPADIQLYDSFVNSFGTSNSHYILLDYSDSKTELKPNETFGFGEAASGLMLGGVPYNDPVVLGAMSAVYQSNQTGLVQIEPYVRDLANTETLPAYMLSTFLFQEEMRNETGYWVTSISNANITSIDYSNGTLLIGIKGNNGSILIASNSGVRNFTADGYSVINIQQGITTSSSLFDLVYVLIAVTVILSVSLALLVRRGKKKET
jgi:hypothetical protein